MQSVQPTSNLKSLIFLVAPESLDEYASSKLDVRLDVSLLYFSLTLASFKKIDQR